MSKKLHISGTIHVEPIHDGTAGGPLTTQASADVSDDGLLYAAYYYSTYPTGEFGFSVNPEIDPSFFPPDQNAWSRYPYLRGLPARWKPIAEELRRFMYEENGLAVPPPPRAPPASQRSCTCPPAKRRTKR